MLCVGMHTLAVGRVRYEFPRRTVGTRNCLLLQIVSSYAFPRRAWERENECGCRAYMDGFTARFE